MEEAKKNEFLENPVEENQETEASTEQELEKESQDEAQNETHEEAGTEKPYVENDTENVLEKSEEMPLEKVEEIVTAEAADTSTTDENGLEEQKAADEFKVPEETLEDSKTEVDESAIEEPPEEPSEKVYTAESPIDNKSKKQPDFKKILERLLNKKKQKNDSCSEKSDSRKKPSKKKFLWILAAIVVLLIVLPKHTHSWSEWKITKEATCTDAGEKERTCECGDKETSTIDATGHSIGNWTITKDATCTINGEKQALCTTCNQTVTESIAATGHTASVVVLLEATCGTTGMQETVCSTCHEIIKTDTIPATGIHSYDNGIIIKNPTCVDVGTKVLTCTLCNATATISLDALGHTDGDWITDAAATCTSNGSKHQICSVCNETIKTETIPALGHTLDNKNKCTICGLTTFTMSSKEITDSKSVKTMSHSVIDYSDDITINITLKDEDGYSVQVPVYVYVKIVDNNGHVLFNDTLIKKSSQSKVSIHFDDMILGYTNVGTIHYQVYNDYVTFGEISKELDCLPWTVDLELPELPDTIWYNLYSSSTACKITEITFKVSGDNMYIYFTGEKTYDSKGSSYSNSCQIGWKLYDSEGYVIDDGICYTTSLKTGEKFKNESITIFDLIEQGESYRLVILDVN